MPSFVELPIFGITIDLSIWQMVLSLPILKLAMVLIAIIGWIPLALLAFFAGAHLWKDIREDLYKEQWEWILLAVDVPPDTIQSPKAVEQIFSQLSAAYAGPNFGEKYWKGIKERHFSFEIISLEGYIQFLIFTEKKFRDLVEAAIYAQYPMAEITEVEDYLHFLPKTYPDNEYDVYGIEFGLIADDPYPIRNYDEFEHNISKDITFADPMAAILENFTRIGAGETLSLQIVIEPISNEWKKKGIDIVKGSLQDKGQQLVKKIVENKKPHHKELFVTTFFNGLVSFLGDGLSHVTKGSVGEHDSSHADADEEEIGKVSLLTPGLKDTVKAIEEKISKVGFKTKLRALYAAKKEVFKPNRCVDGLVGALSQFHYPGRNGLAAKKDTGAHYAFKNYLISERKKDFVKAFKKRKIKIGINPYVLNVEELATLWHFPLPLVKAPLLQKTGSKRAEPPINLPIEVFSESPLKKKVAPPPPEEEKPEEPPELMWG